MLIEFRVTNFRSLREEQTLSFLASPDPAYRDTHCIATGHDGAPYLTRTSVIYGANASGKSNLIWALLTMQHLVLHSTRWSEDQFQEQFTPFRLDQTSAQAPTEFEITLLKAGTRYQYGFAFDARRIQAEWLLTYKARKPQRWFERRYEPDTDTETWMPFSAYFTGPRETWKKATRPQALFLTTAAQLNSEQLKPIFDWFARDLLIVPARTDINLVPLLQRLEEPVYKAQVLKLLNAADIHINDIRVEKRPGQQFALKLEPGKPLEVSTWEGELPDILFLHPAHGQESVWFDRRFESQGTLRLLGYSGPLLDAFEHGKLLVVDEFDTSLHPLLTRYLLGLVHNPSLSSRGAQLWMTTHDTSLLDPDLLRRDQIWFIEKNPEQASQLYSLTEFSPRKNEALERGYLLGRYGALPFLAELRF